MALSHRKIIRGHIIPQHLPGSRLKLVNILELAKEEIE